LEWLSIDFDCIDFLEKLSDILFVFEPTKLFRVFMLLWLCFLLVFSLIAL